MQRSPRYYIQDFFLQEAAAFAEAQKFGTKDLVEVAKLIAGLPKVNSSRPRIVAITQGSQATIIATGKYIRPRVLKP